MPTKPPQFKHKKTGVKKVFRRSVGGEKETIETIKTPKWVENQLVFIRHSFVVAGESEGKFWLGEKNRMGAGGGGAKGATGYVGSQGCERILLKFLLRFCDSFYYPFDLPTSSSFPSNFLLSFALSSFLKKKKNLLFLFLQTPLSLSPSFLLPSSFTSVNKKLFFIWKASGEISISVFSFFFVFFLISVWPVKSKKKFMLCISKGQGSRKRWKEEIF